VHPASTALAGPGRTRSKADVREYSAQAASTDTFGPLFKIAGWIERHSETGVQCSSFSKIKKEMLVDDWR